MSDIAAPGLKTQVLVSPLMRHLMTPPGRSRPRYAFYVEHVLPLVIESDEIADEMAVIRHHRDLRKLAHDAPEDPERTGTRGPIPVWTERITVSVNPDVHGKLRRRQAELDGLPMSNLIRNCLVVGLHLMFCEDRDVEMPVYAGAAAHLGS